MQFQARLGDSQFMSNRNPLWVRPAHESGPDQTSTIHEANDRAKPVRAKASRSEPKQSTRLGPGQRKQSDGPRPRASHETKPTMAARTVRVNPTPQSAPFHTSHTHLLHIQLHSKTSLENGNNTDKRCERSIVTETPAGVQIHHSAVRSRKIQGARGGNTII